MKNYDAKPNLSDMSLDEIEGFIARLGKEKYRARQVMKWIYRAGATDFDEMTNLSKVFKEELEKLARIALPLIEEIQEARDGTKKVLFRLEDGCFIESVLIREKNHWTQCVSTQVGCAMGCRFCLTGRYGLERNLLPSEIVGQITALRFNTPEGENIKNIVMMGMGEPLANYQNVLKAIMIITSDAGAGFSKRKITVSTCGVTPMIRKLGEDVSINLAVSLNAPDEKRRSYLMPVNKKFPLKGLIAACREYPMPRRRRITFEYILMNGINDSEKDARTLAALLRGVHCKFNLIPFNEFPGSEFKRPPDKKIRAFHDVLVQEHYTTMTRPSKGDEISAACGQLSGRRGGRPLPNQPFCDSVDGKQSHGGDI
ncbi:MAG: 23S rRNA (adenine(2503)-C(2))-methyltransferase RlmN [Syntrophales bacterium]|nr:23S rRNA (adenine(2503)-C(2))-methyltransferase RlmN [Syntrophales bacterium]